MRRGLHLDRGGAAVLRVQGIDQPPPRGARRAAPPARRPGWWRAMVVAAADAPAGLARLNEVTCAGCGGIARVPFQPRGDKPVYCSDCFLNLVAVTGVPSRRDRDRREGELPLRGKPPRRHRGRRLDAARRRRRDEHLLPDRRGQSQGLRPGRRGLPGPVPGPCPHSTRWPRVPPTGASARATRAGDSSAA